MKLNFLFILLVSFVITSCKSPIARKPVQHNSGSFISESVERNKEIYENEKKEILARLDSNPNQPYLSSNKGFWYYYNVKIDSVTPMPVFGDEVTFNYTVKDLNGRTILSEKEIGLQKYNIDQTNQELISGIRDGIKLMKEGETVTFFFPSYSAFGYYGIINKLGTNVPIQCTLTLNKINKKNENN